MIKAIRKIAFLFLICLILFFFLLGIVGKSGYIVNKQLDAKIERANESIAYLDVKQASLENNVELLSEVEALDDIALRLGYNKEGEEVFFFSSGDEPLVNGTPSSVLKDEGSKESFKGLPGSLIFLISFLIVFVPYCIIALILKLTKARDEKFLNSTTDKRGENYNDYDF